ncbi:restriction endonuclease subunit S [bacterium]|nr:restriction endonuclease subunit S [bacterium]
MIADIEKQIETLQKYKKSLITEAVTKGLERSVPMKDSEIEWIGEIPSHWGTNRLRYVASVKTGPFGTQLSADEYVDEGVPIINVKNIGYGSILAEDLDFVPETVADRLSAHRLKTDDIVFGRKGAVDKHAIITDEYVNWVQGSDCIRVRSNPEIDSGYLNYLFDSTYFGSYVMLYAVGATMPSMSSDILLNARILVPPVHEQKDIAAYLDSQCGKIDAIIANKQTQLDTIQSHKKSLIYEYVTGKKRVTEVS